MSSAIEQALTSDFLAVAALDRMVWPDTPETFIPDGEHVWRVWAEHATLLVARTTGGLQLSETGDICGAVVMFPSDTGETFLHKIMVHPDSRGQGIGSALMQAALSRAESDVLLTVDPENAPAVQLYRNFGFDIRERVTGYYRPHEDRYVMVYPVRTPSDG
jgi:ribosomal protein S18 acetylase RimI-like enzyme